MPKTHNDITSYPPIKLPLRALIGFCSFWHPTKSLVSTIKQSISFFHYKTVDFFLPKDSVKTSIIKCAKIITLVLGTGGRDNK